MAPAIYLTRQKNNVSIVRVFLAIEAAHSGGRYFESDQKLNPKDSYGKSRTERPKRK
jgi:hypothetical protein